MKRAEAEPTLPAIEIGRLCVKNSGREAGLKCVIVNIIDDNFVLITGPKKITRVKRRRGNIKHLVPLEDKIKISRGASDEEVERALQAEGKIEFMKVKVKLP